MAGLPFETHNYALKCYRVVNTSITGYLLLLGDGMVVVRGIDILTHHRFANPQYPKRLLMPR